MLIYRYYFCLSMLFFIASSAVTDGSPRPEEATKLEERLAKFKDRMHFVTVLQSLPQRKRSSFFKQT